MKKAKNGKKLIALVLVLATMMACMISVFADSITSGILTQNVGGVNYKIYSDLYADNVRTFRAAVYVSTADQSLVPAQTMYAQAAIFDTNSTQAVWVSKSNPNDRANYWTYAVTDPYYTDERVQAGGWVQIYDGFDYQVIIAPKTRWNRSLDISDELRATLDADGNYPKTANGETYGSGLLASIVGYNPDLILARGTNGLSGYIRNEDVSPKIFTREDYEMYIANLEATNRKIPLYDLQGNVIGDFEIGESEDVVPDAESPEVVREAIEREMNKEQHSGLITPMS